MNKNKSFADSLSTRGKNGLIGCLEDADIIYQPEKVSEGRAKLTLARNIGVKFLKEIAFALHKFGCIDDIDKWTES